MIEVPDQKDYSPANRVHPDNPYNEPRGFDDYDCCPSCGDLNDLDVLVTHQHKVFECKTKCRGCGCEAFWAHGFYEWSE